MYNLQMIIKVKIHPNSKENKIISYSENLLEVRIKAPAIENKANKELVNFLSEYFKVNKNSVIIKKGEHSKNKTISIEE